MLRTVRLLLVVCIFFVTLLFTIVVAAQLNAPRWIYQPLTFFFIGVFVLLVDPSLREMVWKVFRRKAETPVASPHGEESLPTAAAVADTQPLSGARNVKRRKRVRLRSYSSNGVSTTANDVLTRRHIEEIRDLLGRMTPCAESVYQYGNPDDALNLLADLTPNDQRRLLALALVEGKKEYTGNAVKQMLLRLNPKYTTLEAVLEDLPNEDRAEIEKSRLRALHGELPDEPKPPAEPTELDCRRITKALSEVSDEIGSLTYEEAVWVFIPATFQEEAVWVDAVGGEDPALSKVRLSWMTLYEPGKEEYYELITMMRRARWVLHVHNHPRELPEEPEVPEASPEDRAFSVSWKYVRPELSEKVKFFVVSGSKALEYSLPGNLTKEWPIEQATAT